MKDRQRGEISSTGVNIVNVKGTDRALVHVLVAGSPDEAGGTGADGPAIQRVGITHCTLVTGITDTCVIQVTQQTCRHRAQRVRRKAAE